MVGDVDEVGAVQPPPCRQPLEMLERDGEGEWVVREFYRDPDAVDAVRVFGTHDTRIEAMRAAKETMEQRRHPCLLRWDDETCVGGLYWNPSFERLAVQYSDLLRSWVVTPGDDHVVFQTADSTDTAYQLGTMVLERYDFERVEFYGHSGEKEAEREHRFLRHEIARSGVRFERGPVPENVERPAVAVDKGRRSETETTTVGGSAVASTLASVLPDITRLEPLDTDGAVHTYRTPWDGRTVRIWVLAPEHADHQALNHAFESTVAVWEDLPGPHVTPVVRRDDAPATWVAYDASDPALADRHTDLTTGERLQVLSQVAAAMTAAQEADHHRTGLTPQRVRIGVGERARHSDAYAGPTGSNDLVAHVAGFGLHGRLAEELNQRVASRYMAPEQLREEQTPTTPVYRLGAVAYWLLAETLPYHTEQAYVAAIAESDLASPAEVADVPQRVSDSIMTAMHPDPDQRYGTPVAFDRALRDAYAIER